MKRSTQSILLHNERRKTKKHLVLNLLNQYSKKYATHYCEINANGTTIYGYVVDKTSKFKLGQLVWFPLTQEFVTIKTYITM